MALQIHYGNAVSGNQRFSRPRLEKKLMHKLKHSAGIKMFGLRRIGKSTSRLYVCEQLKAQGIPFVYFDAQGLQSIEDMLAELFTTLNSVKSDIPNRVINFFAEKHPVRRAFEALISGSKTGERLTEALWQEAFKAIRVCAEESARADKSLVLVIDEFAFLLRNILRNNPKSGKKEVESLLAGMREWRDNGMKMFLTGSIGVSALARKYDFDADHLNDLQSENVPELTQAEAREFIQQATTNNCDYWQPDIIEAFLGQSGVYYPSFLVKGILETNIEQPDIESMPDFFAESIRPNLHNDFYQQFYKRFKLYAEINKNWQQKLLLPILKKILLAEQPVKQAEIEPAKGYTGVDLFNSLFMLEEDGFVSFIEDKDGHRMVKPASRLVQQWFRRIQ